MIHAAVGKIYICNFYPRERAYLPSWKTTKQNKDDNNNNKKKTQSSKKLIRKRLAIPKDSGWNTVRSSTEEEVHIIIKRADERLVNLMYKRNVNWNYTEVSRFHLSYSKKFQTFDNTLGRPTCGKRVPYLRRAVWPCLSNYRCILWHSNLG